MSNIEFELDGGEPLSIGDVEKLAEKYADREIESMPEQNRCDSFYANIFNIRQDFKQVFYTFVAEKHGILPPPQP